MSEARLSLSPEVFQEFYAQTARPLKVYLVRLTRNESIADEVLQEAYYKFLRAELPEFGERERKNYLFRIATNLVRDMYRGKSEAALPLEESVLAAMESRVEEVEVRRDVGKALETLQPRERAMVWLAYVEGWSHREIAKVMGLQEVSIRPMLFRVRQKLAGLLKSIGYCERMVM